MTRLPLIAALAAMALPLAVQAAPRTVDLHARTAGELAAMCGANPREAGADARINYCHGFAQGALDVDMHYSKHTICLPSPAPTRTATLREFEGWVRANAERGRMPAAAGFIRFMQQRFPCK